MVLLSVPILMSITSPRPKCSSMPVPVLPSTPTEWASSIISQALYFLHNSTIFGRSMMSPSIEKTESAMTSLAAPSGMFLSMVSR